MKKKKGGGEYQHFDPLLLASMSVHPLLIASMSVQSVTAHATMCECILGNLEFETHPLWEISLKG
jgi:hypothetical protein